MQQNLPQALPAIPELLATTGANACINCNCQMQRAMLKSAFCPQPGRYEE